MAPPRGGLKGVYKQRKKAKPAPRKKQPSKDAHPTQQQGVVAGGAEEEEEEESLRQFDMDASYGPCIGVARLRRWERAAAMGLRPPPHVRDLILRNHHGGGDGHSSLLPTEKKSDECLWAGKV